MPQLTPEQRANIARSVGGVPLEEKRRIAAELGASTTPRTSQGSTGLWEQPLSPTYARSLSPEDLPAALRIPMQGLAQIGKGAVNVARMPLELAKTAYGALTADPSALAPEEVPAYAVGGPAGLIGHRLLVAPQAEQAKLAAEAPTKTEAVGRGLAAALPMLGPFAAHLGETVGAGRPLEAATEAAIAGVLPKVARETKAYAQRRPVRQGYTRLNQTTLVPEVPANAIKIEMGKRIPPNAEEGALFEFHPAATQAAKTVTGEGAGAFERSMRSTFSRAFPDLIDAVQKNRYLRGPIDTPERFGAATQFARNRVWREGFEPALKAAGDVDLSPVANQLIAEIPESIRVQTPARARALEKTFIKMFDGKVVKAQALHDFAKEARARIQSKLAKNSFDRQAAFGTPDGKMAESFNTALRDRLYQHVKQKTGVDLRPTADAYGALSELEQEALGMPAPTSLLEDILTSYTFPTKRAIAARVGERAGKRMLGDPSLLKKAFANYAEEFSRKPAERAKVTQPFWIQRSQAVAPTSLPLKP